MRVQIAYHPAATVKEDQHREGSAACCRGLEAQCEPFLKYTIDLIEPRGSVALAYTLHNLHMQTFLLNASFEQTAAILDWKPLGKQRLEGMQIIRTTRPNTKKAVPRWETLRPALSHSSHSISRLALVYKSQPQVKKRPFPVRIETMNEKPVALP